MDLEPGDKMNTKALKKIGKPTLIGLSVFPVLIFYALLFVPSVRIEEIQAVLVDGYVLTAADIDALLLLHSLALFAAAVGGASGFLWGVFSLLADRISSWHDEVMGDGAA